MPFAITWSEELVAEWLAIEGYLVETDVPIGSGKGGGRQILLELELKETELISSILKLLPLQKAQTKPFQRYKNKFYWSEKYIKEKQKQKAKERQLSGLKQFKSTVPPNFGERERRRGILKAQVVQKLGQPFETGRGI